MTYVQRQLVDVRNSTVQDFWPVTFCFLSCLRSGKSKKVKKSKKNLNHRQWNRLSSEVQPETLPVQVGRINFCVTASH